MNQDEASNDNPNLIDVTGNICGNFAELLKSSKYSDVTLVVQKKPFPVHRLILAASSDFFQILLFENKFDEKSSSVIPLDAESKPFALLLELMYTGKLDFSLHSLNTILSVFELSHRYNVAAVEPVLENLLITKLNSESFPTILGFANLFGLVMLQRKCMSFVDRWPLKVLGSYESLGLDVKVLEEIFSRDTLNITMINKFECISRLVRGHSAMTKEKQAKLLSLIDLDKLSNKEILRVVRPSKLYDEKFLVDYLAARDSDVHEEPAIEYETSPQPLRHWSMPRPGCILEEEPLAKVTVGKNPAAMFDHAGYCMGELCNNEWIIMVKLKEKFVVNSLAFKLGDSSYSFSINVSSNRKKWRRVYQQNNECSTKRLRICFPEGIVQYIKLVGVIEVCGFIADYAADTKFMNGIFVPTFNVANEISAYCIPQNFNRILAEIRPRNSMIPFEAIPNKKILKICFTQPFWLRCCRLRLWDHDKRRYKFKIHVIEYGNNAKCIFDNSTQAGVTGWKQITFAPQRVVRFEITTIGTTHARNLKVENEFRLVYFEAE